MLSAFGESQPRVADVVVNAKALQGNVSMILNQATAEAIRSDLEKVVLSVEEYNEEVSAFAREWDRLSPRVSAWSPGDDIDLLLEYQSAAESLVQTFHAQSDAALAQATDLSRKLADRGDNMTQRRQLQTRLLDAVNKSRKAWQECASQIVMLVGANNSLVRGASQTVMNLTPRIAEGMEHHRELVEKKLQEERISQWVAQKSDLEAAVIQARARYEGLSRQVRAQLESDRKSKTSTIRMQEQLADETAEQQATVFRAKDALHQIELELSAAQQPKVRMPSGMVKYQPLEATSIGYIDAARKPWAILCGALASLAFYMYVWWFRSRARRAR